MTIRVRKSGGTLEWLGGYSADTVARQGVGETLIAQRDGKLRAQASIWWEGVAQLDGKPTGAVGHYGALEDEAGIALLADAVRRLQARGCHAIVGPMDGTTWRRYRFVTEGTAPGGEPPFFMEPENPASYIRQFKAAGFEPLSHYYSSLDATLEGDDSRVDEAIPSLAERGVRIRDIDPPKFTDELTRVHALSLNAFAGNFMYSPISREEFITAYAGAEKLVLPGMVLMAEDAEDNLVGFMFAIPDVRNPQTKTAIAKTVAVKPGRTGAGLGSVLIEMSRRAARKHGFRRLIYALMHEQNRSTKIAGRFGEKFRGYTLYVHRGTGH